MGINRCYPTAWRYVCHEPLHLSFCLWSARFSSTDNNLFGVWDWLDVRDPVAASVSFDNLSKTSEMLTWFVTGQMKCICESKDEWGDGYYNSWQAHLLVPFRPPCQRNFSRLGIHLHNMIPVRYQPDRPNPAGTALIASFFRPQDFGGIQCLLPLEPDISQYLCYERWSTGFRPYELINARRSSDHAKGHDRTGDPREIWNFDNKKKGSTQHPFSGLQKRGKCGEKSGNGSKGPIKVVFYWRIRDERAFQSLNPSLTYLPFSFTFGREKVKKGWENLCDP